MSRTSKWLLRILIGLILIGIGLLIGYFLFRGKPTPPAQEETTTSTETEKTDESTTGSEGEQAQNGEGWKIFKNLAQKYLIEYPQGATVENASGSESEKGKEANQSSCVTISTDYVWVTIAGRFIEDIIECTRTGFGTEWGNAPDEKVTIQGQEYTDSGMYTSSASAGYYRDHYVVDLVSGEKISYGITVNEKTDPTMTKDQAKELVHKILASFSPAE